jgi:hypothetical protein
VEGILIEAGFTWVINTIKNPKKKTQYKAVILKVFKTIWTHFANDPEFKTVVGNTEE